MGLQQRTRGASRLEGARFQDAVLRDGERILIAGRCFRGLGPVQRVVDPGIRRPAQELHGKGTVEEPGIARQIRRGNQGFLRQGIRGRQAIPIRTGSPRQPEGQFTALQQFIVGDELLVHGLTVP